MDYLIILLLFILLIFGATWIFTIIRYLLRLKRKKIKLRSCPKRLLITVFSLLIIATLMSIGSLYFLTDGYVLDGVPYSFTIEKSIKHYGYFGNYKLVERIDPVFSSQPIVIIQNDKDLTVCMLKTRQMLIGIKKYWVNGGFTLVDGEERFGYLIDENQVSGGLSQAFPNVWFGIIHPENRDKIRVNGKIPNFYDIHFNGTDYVFWYIEKNGEDANLNFE